MAGATWDTTYFDKTLIDPVCQGSILSLGRKKGKEILAFCNSADTKNSDNLLLRISYDEGKTWKKNIPVYKGPAVPKPNFAYAAYSDLVKIDKTRIGILYEKDQYATITFVVKNWK